MISSNVQIISGSVLNGKAYIERPS
ncbi:MAG: hypothetical protein J1E01_08310 [Acetatifactor sp.]|nr:hypothetical protein [Acetatifactor sp.]